MSELADRWGVFANAVGDRVLAPGALVLCYWLPGMNDRVTVFGRSRGGRRVEIWRALTALKNFRVKWVEPRFRTFSWDGYSRKSDAEAVLERFVVAASYEQSLKRPEGT